MIITSFLETATFCSLVFQICSDNFLIDCYWITVKCEKRTRIARMESGRKERWVDSGLLLQQSFISGFHAILCCHVLLTVTFPQSSIVYRLCYLSFQESKSASSWNGEEVKPKTRKWSSQGREKWVRII